MWVTKNMFEGASIGNEPINLDHILRFERTNVSLLVFYTPDETSITWLFVSSKKYSQEVNRDTAYVKLERIVESL